MKYMRGTTVRQLGALIRSRRQELKLTQQQLAERVRVRRQWVIQLERGNSGAELRLVLRALDSLDLHVTLTPRPPDVTTKPSDIDQMFARLKRGGGPKGWA